MKKALYNIFLSCLLVSCNSVSENDVPEKIDLKEFYNEIFEGYKYEYDTDRGKSSTQLLVVKIKKQDFSSKDYEGVKNDLIKRRWDLVDSYNSYYNFCKNNYYSVGILNPIYDKHYTRDGEEVNFKNKDYWYFALYYNKLGVNNCMEYYSK
ncbi:hypothetical protein ACG9XS_06815 [Acinetobacter gyllenbergii]|uniref:hypothetical protein n=1 Tax=Acinetobacter gyllenbergii TaxID=134534 RepID=UPI0003BE1751|nr:hypothetical protein [Acinetobacter gyllenbergii]ESK48263.1 hypothetical protein F987_01748 [Acinetobacter gyllenbergii NIPH 230]